MTLVELMLAGVTTLILVGGTALVLSESVRQVWARTDGQLVALNDAQRALDRVSEDLRGARQANVTCTAGRVDYDPADGSARVTYQLNAQGNLVRTQGGTSRTVTSGLTAFTPSCQANGRVRIQLAAQFTTAQGGASTRTLDSQVRIHNP